MADGVFSRGIPVIIVEHSAQPLSPADGSCRALDRLARSDQPIVEALVIPFKVIMSTEVPNRIP